MTDTNRQDLSLIYPHSEANIERIAGELSAVEVLHRLVQKGIVLGALEDGVFSPWDNPHDIDAAMRAWRTLERDPNIGDPVWFTTHIDRQ